MERDEITQGERGKKNKNRRAEKNQEEKWTGTETLSDKREQERQKSETQVNFVSCKYL